MAAAQKQQQEDEVATKFSRGLRFEDDDEEQEDDAEEKARLISQVRGRNRIDLGHR